MIDYKKEYYKWLDSPALSEKEWLELNSISKDEEEIKSRFYAPLSFGTAGIRGTMKLGLHHLNVHIIRQVTQAFSELISDCGEEARKKGIIICYDCRNNSELFAKEAASVIAGNGICVKIFPSLRPTPELSFAIRHLNAQAGINITASHNPKEYNGYKVYWSDGAQLPPAMADSVTRKIDNIDVFSGFKSISFDDGIEKGLIEILDDDIDTAFLNACLSQSLFPEYVKQAADALKIAYTPFHGAGYMLVPRALSELGLKSLTLVEEQMKVDGDFPTIVSPNPENPESFSLAESYAMKAGCNLIIGTDPDADRVAVHVLKGDSFVALSGNQVGALLLNYLISSMLKKNMLPEKAAVCKSIVSTELATAICEKYKITLSNTFTGFKFMAEQIAKWEQEGSHKSIFAFEESIGYLFGDYLRDKDAVTTSIMITEMASYYAINGKTLLDALQELYEEFGYYSESTQSIVLPGIKGQEEIAALMSSYRGTPPKSLLGLKVRTLSDYLSGTVYISGIDLQGTTSIMGSDVLLFSLEDGSKFIVRPSGTEPKIKFYFLCKGSSAAECDSKINLFNDYCQKIQSQYI